MQLQRRVLSGDGRHNRSAQRQYADAHADEHLRHATTWYLTYQDVGTTFVCFDLTNTPQKQAMHMLLASQLQLWSFIEKGFHSSNAKLEMVESREEPADVWATAWAEMDHSGCAHLHDARANDAARALIQGAAVFAEVPRGHAEADAVQVVGDACEVECDLPDRPAE
eukprot:4853311-Pleurochrysis_carterae.AAC.2